MSCVSANAISDVGMNEAASRVRRSRSPIGALGAVLAVCASAAGAQTPPPAPQMPTQLQPPPEPSVEVERYDPGLEDVERALMREQSAAPIEPGGPRAAEATRYRGSTVRGRERPDYQPVGLPAGAFTVFPRLDLDVIYDANVFATARERGDLLLRPQASVRADSNWSRHKLTFEGLLNRREYSRFTTENGTEYRLSAQGRLDVAGRSSIEARAVRERAIIDRSAVGELPNSLRPIRYDLSLGSLGGSLRSGRVTGRLVGTFSKRDYHDGQTLAGAPLDQQDRDFHRTQIRGELGYNITSAQELFVSVQLDRQRYRVQIGPIDRDSNGIELLGGIRGEITPLIRGQLALGMLRQNFIDPSVQTSTSLGLDTRLEWLVTELTNITLTARREVQNSAVRASAAYVGTDFRLQADHELLRNLLLTADVAFSTADYRASPRRDKTYEGGAGADWLINRNMRARFRLNASKRTSNDPGRPVFNDLRTSIGLSYAL